MSLVARANISRSILLRTAQTAPQSRALSTTNSSYSQVNPALNLDPSLQALLKDVDISLTRHKVAAPSYRELDIIPSVNSEETQVSLVDSEDPASEILLKKKSPAALFGSHGIGAIVLPLEMQNAINLLITESDKPMLRNDAKRLFQREEDAENADWSSDYDKKYRSRQQAARHSERDGTAFASVALPVHYSAILAVLTHVKHRLGPDWNISRVIDWGAGTGSGLWASLHTFQRNEETSQDVEGLKASDSSVQTYIGIDKRDGLVTIGKRLLRDIPRDDLTVSWQRAFHEGDKVSRTLGLDTLAISAFNLSSIATDLARKSLVKEMWESGAHTLVLIDHNTPTGFENIAEARALLLKMGRKEMEDPETADWPIRGSYVVAPCPHDGECPLYHPGSIRLVCGFSQRLQRPSFVRLTKHSKVGHEDTGYSYVVVQRGQRPIRSNTKLGRIGSVGSREIHRELESHSQALVKDLAVHNENNNGEEDMLDDSSDEIIAEAQASAVAAATSAAEKLRLPPQAQLDEDLRQEAFSWPRLVFPPLKKSGHIILDACTPEGKIMRLTIPKSQGKQPFYDARKSSWGDIFPHDPKNAPQERHQPKRAKREGGTTPVKGADIGKRRTPKEKIRVSYEALSEDLKEVRTKSKRDRGNRGSKGATQSRRAYDSDAY